MTNQIDNWLNEQSEKIFGGVQKPRRGKRPYAFLLTLPFFFVPILIAGYFVADVGDALSNKAVAFLQSAEKRPVGVERKVTTVVARPTFKKRALVASKTK